MAKSPATILYDSTGANPVGVVLDGAIYRLQSAAKLANVAGSFINPASQETLASLDGKDFATQTTLATRASETTLAQADGRLTTIDSVLDAIKDTDGVKKIVDALPAGTNEIGKVAQGTKGAGANAWPEVLYDAAGVELAVAPETTIPSNTKGLLAAAKGEDGKAYFLVIDANNALKVASSLPSPPIGVTEVVIAQAEANLEIAGGDSPADTEYVITNGKTFHIQLVTAGAAGDPSEKGSRIDVLYYDGSAYHIFSRIYIQGQTVYEAFPDSSKARDGTVMVGNGSTKKVVLRRIRLSTAAQEVDGEIRGYEVTT